MPALNSERGLFERFVFIELPGAAAPVPAGLFSLDTDTGVGRFSYGRLYLQRPDALALDPVNLPLAAREYLTRKNRGIFGVLGDLLPDSWGRYVLAKRLGLPFGTLRDHELFEHLTTNAVGALSLGISPERPTTPVEPPAPFAELQQVAEVFALALSDAELPPEVDYLLAQGTSLGGAQPKCPVVHEGRQWIAKFENRRTPVKMPRIEYATMRLAERAGLCVPETRLEEIGGQAVYLIERFDRKDARRLPFLSAHALVDLDLEELEKGSYLDIARRMRIFVEEVSADLHELYRRLAFNLFVGNRDDHLRNHGFIHDGQGWRLAPLYDALPIPARPASQPFSLALNFGDEGARGTLANLMSRHREFNLDERGAATIIAEVAGATADWEGMLKELGVVKEDIEAVRWPFEGFRTLFAAELAALRP